MKNPRVHLAVYRTEIADAGEIMANDKSELIDLAWAYEQALGYYTMKTAPLFYGR